MSVSRWDVVDGYRVQPYVLEPGAGAHPRPAPGSLPDWAQAQDLLPAIVWDGRPEVERACARAWELAWQHLRDPQPGPFAGIYLDSAFNGNVFMWDSAFAQRYMVYARRCVDAQLLDGFYAAQADDGWICRTMTPDGRKIWERHDPSSSGPNVLAWIELECARRTADLERLADLLPALVAYHRWLRRYRTWPSGAYWSTGWGCGMDGLPRLPEGVDPNFEHGRVSWVDATLQALLSAKSILAIAELTEHSADLSDVEEEAVALEHLVSERFWDAELRAFTDLSPDQASMGTLHIGTFWSLLAVDLSSDRLAPLLQHLTDPAGFGRPFPVPALSSSNPAYRPDGGYWLGGVWTPTTLMVLDGLRAVGASQLAHELGRRHLDLVCEVLADTGTIWENYAPERPAPGSEARPDFVGWGGASVITVGIEHVLGIETRGTEVTWRVEILERHGVRRLPVGPDATVDAVVESRADAFEEPRLIATTDKPVTFHLQWPGGSRTLSVEPEDSFGRP